MPGERGGMIGEEREEGSVAACGAARLPNYSLPLVLSTTGLRVGICLITNKHTLPAFSPDRTEVKRGDGSENLNLKL